MLLKNRLNKDTTVTHEQIPFLESSLDYSQHTDGTQTLEKAFYIIIWTCFTQYSIWIQLHLQDGCCKKGGGKY